MSFTLAEGISDCGQQGLGSAFIDQQPGQEDANPIQQITDMENEGDTQPDGSQTGTFQNAQIPFNDDLSILDWMRTNNPQTASQAQS